MLLLVFPLCFDTSASPDTLYTHPPLSHLLSVGRWHPVGSVTAPSGFTVVIIPASTALWLSLPSLVLNGFHGDSCALRKRQSLVLA
ncbi:hypothetical protein AOLI_G00206030 [Acnodon oligacanthus]